MLENKIMQKILYLFIALLSFQLSIAQSSLSTVDMIYTNWKIPENAAFEQFDNRETLVLNGGRATVKNLNFTNGTIEVDVYANSVRSFPRPWRKVLSVKPNNLCFIFAEAERVQTMILQRLYTLCSPLICFGATFLFCSNNFCEVEPTGLHRLHISGFTLITMVLIK